MLLVILLSVINYDNRMFYKIGHPSKNLSRVQLSRAVNYDHKIACECLNAIVRFGKCHSLVKMTASEAL